MTFLDLLHGVGPLSQRGNPDVTGLEYDSRRVQTGNAFVAMRGEASDGNEFIDKAIASGAVAIITDSAEQEPRDGVAWARVAHGRQALARLSANFYRQPAERLAITGITGTNGKSTTAFIMEEIFTASGRKSALIGTIEYHVAGEVLPAPHTTPESLDLNRIFAKAVKAGSSEVVMEVSSHALVQQRVYSIPFQVAVFTNLTRDHLDYHRTMEEYFAAKQILFKGCGSEPPQVAVLNTDDEYARSLATISDQLSETLLTYGITRGDFRTEKLEISPRGTSFDLMTPDGRMAISSGLIGKVNVYNLLAAAAASYGRGCNLEAIANGIANIARVPGRFERVDCNQPFTVVVDYAHTDDALRNLTALARDFVERASRRGRVITVFGCGGDRDRAKRPLMGEAAGRGSDFVILTSDNPRSEDPFAIMNDAMVGLQRSGVKYKMEPGRKAAIALAIREARPGDIVLLAGKGHEKTQTTREGVSPFDDVQVVREVLKDAGYDCLATNAAAQTNSGNSQ
jgi:UDP-N-acetylmuramoyl-L-alanyl-D-glutamate--2,6-diaminopimelate ligase